MRSKRRVGKSYVIHTLEISFTLLNKKNKFMISAPTECVAESIGRNIVHIALNISNHKAKSLYINISIM